MRRWIAITLGMAQLLAGIGGSGAMAALSADLDGDGDGLSLNEEFLWGTDPTNPDSDGGGAADGWEVMHGRDPVNRADDYEDKDNDGWDDYREFLAGTNPDDPDTDDDGMIDSLDPDPLRTDFSSNNNDDDGIGPGPVPIGGNPLPNPGGPPGQGGFRPPGEPRPPEDDEDWDLDGLTNELEYRTGVDPFDPDTDDDGLSDGSELSVAYTDPLDVDTDGDRLWDSQETGPLTPADTVGQVAAGVESPDTFGAAGLNASRFTRTDPRTEDTDGDGVTDSHEDPDRDRLPNGAELPDRGPYDYTGGFVWIEFLGRGDPHNPDTDCDGLLDGIEVYGDPANERLEDSDPDDPDTDDDGIGDRLDPHPEAPTVLPEVLVSQVTVNGVRMDGTAGVTVRKGSTVLLSGRVFFLGLNNWLPVPANAPVDVTPYFVQDTGNGWVARQVGPAITTGDGRFDATLRLNSDELRAGLGFVVLRVGPYNDDYRNHWLSATEWREPGTPAFSFASLAVCAAP